MVKFSNDHKDLNYSGKISCMQLHQKRPLRGLIAHNQCALSTPIHAEAKRLA
jgi:hypothetical protein